MTRWLDAPGRTGRFDEFRIEDWRKTDTHRRYGDPGDRPKLTDA